MAREKPFKRFAQIGHQMEAVSTLHRLGNRCLCCCSIVPSTIPAHDLNFWVGFHPGGCGCGFSVRQDIEDLMTLQIDQKRAEGAATLERKVINPKLANLPDRLGRQGHNAPENGMARGLDSQPIGDTNAQPATCR